MQDFIYGKDNTARIVSVEIKDNTLEVYRELEDESIEVEVRPYKHWFLSSRPFSKEHKFLTGSLLYKYINYYDTYDEYQDAKKRNWKNDIFVCHNLKEAALIINGMSYYKDMKVNDVSILAFDIETTGLTHNNDSKVLIISNTFRSQGKVYRKLFTYDEFKTEKEMFDAWCQWVRDINPSVVVGHNIYTYDFPYLAFCAKKAGAMLKLGRDDSDLRFDERESKKRIDGSRDQSYHRPNIYGREICDTYFLSLTYDFSRKYYSYGLKNIIKQEGLEVEGRQFYDASKIYENYKIKEEWEKIKAYALHDADDTLALFDLMIPAYFYLNNSIPKPFQSMIESATGSQINSFLIRSYLQIGHSIPKGNEAIPFEGALSAGIPGVYKNVVKWDVKSMYPSIMIQYNIHDSFKDPKGHFIKMVRYFTNQRFESKRLAKETGDRYYTDLEQSQKIVINSAYGLLGAPGLNFNSPNNAALVTRKGREILQIAIKWATGEEYTKPCIEEESDDES